MIKRKSVKLPTDHPGTLKLEILMRTGRPIADILEEYLPESEDEILNFKFLQFSDNIVKLVPGTRTECKMQGLAILFKYFHVKDVDKLDRELFTKQIPALLRGFSNYEEMKSQGSDQ